MRDFVFNFLIAGRDTTASLLTWTFYELSRHPEVEEKVIEEINSVIKDENANFKNIKLLKYTKWVLQEVLRLYPPVPIDGYTALEDDILPNGYFVAKNTEIYYVAWHMHRLPEYFPEPELFLPERWEFPLKHPFSYVPFHGGARACLGKEMAYQESLILMVNIFKRNFRLRTVEGFLPRVKKAVILTSANGLKMKLVRV